VRRALRRERSAGVGARLSRLSSAYAGVAAMHGVRMRWVPLRPARVKAVLARCRWPAAADVRLWRQARGVRRKVLRGAHRQGWPRRKAACAGGAGRSARRLVSAGGAAAGAGFGPQR
jgi:hypothetical protein